MINLLRAHASLKAAPAYTQYACGDFLPTCHNSDARFSELLAILIRVACNKSARQPARPVITGRLQPTCCMQLK